jgi:hypothetical protein
MLNIGAAGGLLLPEHRARALSAVRVGRARPCADGAMIDRAMIGPGSSDIGLHRCTLPGLPMLRDPFSPIDVSWTHGRTYCDLL